MWGFDVKIIFKRRKTGLKKERKKERNIYSPDKQQQKTNIIFIILKIKHIILYRY